MPHYNYGYQNKGSEENIAKAQQYNIDASYKDLCAVCTNIRGLTPDKGVAYLNSVLNDGFPVKYNRWNKHLGHRRELGGKRGRYPVKATKFVLMVLTNAIANADTKGILDPVIVHASANKQSIYSRLQPKGRQSKADYETARIEIVLLGKAASKKPEPTTKKSKPTDEKKPETKTETKTEVKKVETKPETKTEIKKTETKTEVKTEAKKEEVKTEQKVEVKKEEKQTIEAKPTEIKKEEKKSDDKK